MSAAAQQGYLQACELGECSLDFQHRRPMQPARMFACMNLAKNVQIKALPVFATWAMSPLLTMPLPMPLPMPSLPPMSMLPHSPTGRRFP